MCEKKKKKKNLSEKKKAQSGSQVVLNFPKDNESPRSREKKNLFALCIYCRSEVGNTECTVTVCFRPNDYKTVTT